MSTASPLAKELSHDILTAWGDDRLIPVPADAMPTTAVSPSTQALLTEIGLPDYVHENITFYHDQRLLQLITLDGVDYHLLGEDAGNPLAVKAHSDEVWAIGVGRIPRRFVNTHPAFLVLFLGVLLPAYELLRGAEPAEANVAIGDLKAAFIEYDPLAFTDPNSWWPSLLDVARTGYL
jgi:SUKH-4 immunity protein of toxin-antitoxin system